MFESGEKAMDIGNHDYLTPSSKLLKVILTKLIVIR